MPAWKGVVVGLLVAALMAAGPFVSAQEGQGKPTDPFQNLGLSTDQRNKIDVVTNERKTAMTASQQKIVGIRQKLVSLLFDKKAKDQEIDKLTDQLATADREALVAQIKLHKAMRQILTQEQLAALNKGVK